jgi:hypothetical protein
MSRLKRTSTSNRIRTTRAIWRTIRNVISEQ